MQQNWEAEPKGRSSGREVFTLKNQLCWLAEFKLFSLVFLLLPSTTGWHSQTALIRHDLLNLGLSSFEIYKKAISALHSVIAAQDRPRQFLLGLQRSEMEMGPWCFPDQLLLIVSTCSWNRVHSIWSGLCSSLSSYWLVSILCLKRATHAFSHIWTFTWTPLFAENILCCISVCPFVAKLRIYLSHFYPRLLGVFVWASFVLLVLL